MDFQRNQVVEVSGKSSSMTRSAAKQEAISIGICKCTEFRGVVLDSRVVHRLQPVCNSVGVYGGFDILFGQKKSQL